MNDLISWVLLCDLSGLKKVLRMKQWTSMVFIKIRYMIICTLSIFVHNTVTKIRGQTRYFSNSVQACEHLMNTYILTFFAFYHWPFILAAWFKLSLAFLLWNSFNPHIKAVSTLAHLCHFCKIVNIQVIIKLLLLLLLLLLYTTVKIC